MEITITLMVILKALGFIVGSVFLAVIMLFPINDRPTSMMQVVAWLVVEAVAFALLFGFVSIKFVVS